MEGQKNHHESKTPTNTDGRLLVKLKVQKSTEEMEEAEVEPVSPPKKSHFCHECNKGFSSGKALGGHMSSAHVQARECLKKLKFNKSTEFKRDGSSSDAATKETVCKICGKDFPSLKSLFGHMRCHPDREWRGMKPPKEQAEKITRDFSPSLSNHDDDDESLETDNHTDYYDVDAAAAMATGTGVVAVVDLTESLSSWTVKGKRGREGVRKCLLDIDPLSDEEEKKMQDAVDQLISLVNGDSSHPNPKAEPIKEDVYGASGSKKKRVEVHPAARDRRDSPVNKQQFSETATDSEETVDGVLDKKGKGKALRGLHFKDERSASSESKDTGLSRQYDKSTFFSALGLDKMKIEPQNHNFYDEFAKGNVVVKNKRRRQRATTMSSETEGEITPVAVDQKLDGLIVETPEKLKCSTCDKTFSTHQALGGHRSSHNKLKVNVQNTANGSSPFPVGDENHEEIGGADASNLVEKFHQCKICKKTFTTGQALGGHKRCHWPGLSSQVSSPGADEYQTSVRKVLEFDLNEPAVMDDANISGFGNAIGSQH